MKIYRKLLLIAMLSVSLTAFAQSQNILIDGDVDRGMSQTLVQTLTKAAPGDEIHIFLTSDGGSVDSGLQILYALENTKAKTHIHVSSKAYSMAAFMLCYADEVSFSNYATVMYHAMTVTYTDGKRKQILPHTVSSPEEKTLLKVTDVMLNQCKYKGFLKNSHIEQIKQGKEVWFVGKFK
jgi:ATP-dependent protease ClpP protease subunit